MRRTQLSRTVPLQPGTKPLTRSSRLQSVPWSAAVPMEGAGKGKSAPTRKRPGGPKPCSMCREPLEPGNRWYCTACQQVRALVLARDNYSCVDCGKPLRFEHYSLGHRLRASHGGRPVPSNLITLWGLGGEYHHGRIDLYRDPDDKVKGYRLDSGQDPKQVPVRVWAGPGKWRTAFLWDDGHYHDVPEPAVAA